MANLDKRYSKEDIENQGADKDFEGFPMREMVGYDATTGQLRRVLVNEEGALDTSTMDTLIDELTSLVNSLKFLAGAQGIASDLRVTLLSGTVTTVTTVTTLTGQTNIGGFGAQHTIMNQMNTNANQLRDRITIT